MNDKCNEGFKEAVCIHTDKVYDSCRELHYASYKTSKSLTDRGLGLICFYEKKRKQSIFYFSL